MTDREKSLQLGPERWLPAVTRHVQRQLKVPRREAERIAKKMLRSPGFCDDPPEAIGGPWEPEPPAPDLIWGQGSW